MVLTLKRICPAFSHFDKEELKGGKTFHAASTTKNVLKEKKNITFVCAQNIITISEKSRFLIKK